jgi:hypothetical protein
MKPQVLFLFVILMLFFAGLAQSSGRTFATVAPVLVPKGGPYPTPMCPIDECVGNRKYGHNHK